MKQRLTQRSNCQVTECFYLIVPNGRYISGQKVMSNSQIQCSWSGDNCWWVSNGGKTSYPEINRGDESDLTLLDCVQKLAKGSDNWTLPRKRYLVSWIAALNWVSSRTKSADAQQNFKTHVSSRWKAMRKMLPSKSFWPYNLHQKYL